jgi:hydroxymethylpyrimidine pyrophosphatase-like HAD family hydrolase
MTMANLIVCDIEGCLSPAKGERLSLLDLHALQLALLEPDALSFVLCTGRPQPFVEAYSQMLGLQKASVAENGAYLFDPVKDRIILNPLMSEQQLLDIRYMKQHLADLIPGVEFRVEPGKEVCISLNPVGNLENYPEEVVTLYERVRNGLSDKSVFITHSASAVDITPNGIDKGSGVKFLAEYLDMDLSQMLGIGDTQGDMPFLELVGQSAAPANATGVVRQYVDYVSSHKDAAGVVDIVQHFRSRAKRGQVVS